MRSLLLLLSLLFCTSAFAGQQVTGKLAVFGNVGIGTSSSSPYVTNSAPAGGLIVQSNVGIGTFSPILPLHIIGNAYLNGNVGIGTPTPQTNLAVNGNVGIGTSSALARLMVQGGNVGIGTINANQKLTVSGVIYSTTGGLQFPDNTTQTTAAVTANQTFKFISKTSPSAATNSGDISITSTNYYFVTINVNFSADDKLALLFNNDSGAHYGASGANFTSASQIVMGTTALDGAVAVQHSWYIYIFPQMTTGSKKNFVSGSYFGSTPGGLVNGGAFTGGWANSATATSFRIVTQGGNNMTGDINLYQIQQQ